MNLSQQKRTRMLSFLRQLKTRLEDSESLAAVTEIENELLERKYGLVWEQHEEAADLCDRDFVPVFKEEKAREIRTGGDQPFHFLLEGDNLHSLRLLEKTHSNRIELIYIDPPYNTGSEDFIYDDCYVDEEDGYRHSKWLSFMARRLKCARRLLTEDGVMFIQISDVEAAQLKLLCDSVFGEENFLNIISVNMKNTAGASGGGEGKRLKKNCEYILVYARQYDRLPVFNGPFVYTELSELIAQYMTNGISWKYTSVLVDEGTREYAGSATDGDGNEIKVYRRNGLVIKSVKQAAEEEGISEKEAYRRYGLKIFRTTNAQSSIRTRIIRFRQENPMENDVISIEYTPKTGKNKGRLYEQFYKGDSCALFVWLKDTSEVRDGILYKKDLQGTYWDFTAGTKNLTKEGNVEFCNGKKPISLLKQIISMYPRRDITVLDFFAGSGSTGHAVLALNDEDGGNRRFILCSGNEISNSVRDKYLLERQLVPGKNGISGFMKTEEYRDLAASEDYQNLGIVRSKTYPRLRNVISGYVTDRGRRVEGLPANLKYYKVCLIPRQDHGQCLWDRLMEYVPELVQLENGRSMADGKQVLLTTDQEADELEKCLLRAACISEEETAQALALRQETPDLQRQAAPQAVYIAAHVFLTAAQEKMFWGIGRRLVPEYYFERELREAGELW